MCYSDSCAGSIRADTYLPLPVQHYVTEELKKSAFARTADRLNWGSARCCHTSGGGGGGGVGSAVV